MIYNKKNTVAIQIDNIANLNLKSDSSIFLAYIMQKHLNLKTFFYNPQNITHHYNQKENQTIAHGHFYNVKLDHIETTKQDLSFQLIKNSVHSTQEKISLQACKLVLIRQNPPINMQYIANTNLLQISNNNLLILNHPNTIINLPEKLIPIIASFPTPDSIITSNIDDIYEFILQHQEVVLKPLYHCAGSGVTKVKLKEAKNKTSLIQSIQKHLNRYSKNDGYIIVQKFLDIVQNKGDIRALFMEGHLLGYFNRLPKKGGFLTNIAQGATISEVKENDKALHKINHLLNDIAKKLKELNIFFAGVDLIGESIIEVNITSPTGMIQLYSLQKTTEQKILLEQKIAKIIENRISSFENKFHR